MSRQKLKADLRRLRLKEGDIVLVRDELTMEALCNIGPIEGVPPCPIVFAPQGVHRLDKEYVRKLLEKL